MFNMNKERWYYLYIAVFVMVFFVLLPFYYKHYGIVTQSDQRDEKIRTELISEFERLQPLPGAVLVTSSTLIRSGSGFIFFGFSTELNDATILKYYDKQLKDNGWTFLNDEAIKNWGFDTKERNAVYTNGKYNAYIGYGYDENRRGKIRFSIMIDKPVK